MSGLIIFMVSSGLILNDACSATIKKQLKLVYIKYIKIKLIAMLRKNGTFIALVMVRL